MQSILPIMKKIQVNINSVLSTVSEKDIHALETSTAADALEKLREGTGEGNDFLWNRNYGYVRNANMP